MRTEIRGQQFDEERALYNAKHTDVVECIFAGPADGESVLKEARDIRVTDTKFSLRYPLWHVQGFEMERSAMDELTRAAIWYARDGVIRNCELGGIKAVRECENITLTDCDVVSPEFGWKSRGLTLCNTTIEAEYPFLDSKDVRLENCVLAGKYSFQYVENLVIEDSVLDTKDAFWHARNVTVRNSVIRGEYLGWYSTNLTLEHCRIEGTQPFCYCNNLTLVDCELVGCDLAFENSSVCASITGHVDSIKNPRSGRIVVDSVGELIIEQSPYPNMGEVVVRKPKA